MKGCFRGCLASLGLMVVVVASAWAGWRWGEVVFPEIEERVFDMAAPEGPAPSAALSELTLDRVEALRASSGAESRLELDGLEVSSVLRYTLPGIIPPGVDAPEVELRDGKVVLRARVATAAFPDLPALGEVLGLLPDTVDMQLRGALVPFGPGMSALHIERLEAERIPLPSRFIPRMLASFGRQDREGLPDDAVAVPLPSGLGRAFVEGSHLVLTSDG